MIYRPISVYWLALVACCAAIGFTRTSIGSEPSAPLVRERAKFDFGWRFAFGHATNRDQDFDPGNSFPFNYLAKTGNAVGAASANFDDRAWRELDLPHDWAVEAPFDERASNSHGSKAVGRNFPERSVGWYRKTFFVPAGDLGKRISIEFDGIFRDSQVWINGHYLGREESGYTSFAYNISEYLNYGGENVVAVRVDASLEEGWFYEGAGIYRHVWLLKTDPLHVEKDGTFVTTEVSADAANVTARVNFTNEGLQPATVRIQQAVVDAEQRTIAESTSEPVKIEPSEHRALTTILSVDKPQLWSLESPRLYTLVTTISEGTRVADRYETPFGIRTIRFDPDEGFFLNGKHVRLYGTNNHQDHAGVGAAIPDALQEFRIARLKEIGCNAYRCSHNPPAPELLDVCDRLGMLVVDENRAMGTSATQLGQLERLIRRDRNHPCVVLWSIGNEEWRVEGNEKGERVAATMQALVQRLDPTRRVTVASSGGWGHGYSIPIDVMGFNYHTHGNTDDFHTQFPDKPSIGTEEGSTFSTRGVYVEDRKRQHLTSYDENKPDWGALAREGWGHYANRKYVAGLFIWTGFDYRGEPTPFEWPAIGSQFGILDTCGFRKDNSYYYEAWWTDKPLVHLLPHWNWQGKEGQSIRVWAHSNCDEIELTLNDQNLGRKNVERNSHAEWEVPFESGTLMARGFDKGVEVATDRVETTGEPVAVKLTPHRSSLQADSQDVSIVTVYAVDAAGRHVPVANHEITFDFNGPGRIIGVGNGNPSSHEPDQYLDDVTMPKISWRMQPAEDADSRAEVALEFDDTQWRPAIGSDGREEGRHRRGEDAASRVVYRGTVMIPALSPEATVTLDLQSLGNAQSVYFNGNIVESGIPRNAIDHRIDLDHSQLRAGKNVIAVIVNGSSGVQDRGRERRYGGSPAVLRIVTSTGPWKRRLFNGLAQVIVQATDQPGEIELKAGSSDLEPASIRLTVHPVEVDAVAQSATRGMD